jgi:glycosyltransferase 2 family protein
VKTLSRLRFDKRWLRWAGTAVATGLFAWLLVRQDWHSTWQNLALLNGWLIPLALGLYYAGELANAARWHVLLRAQSAPVAFFETVKIVFAGAFVSNFLPSTIGGDAVRIVYVRRYFSGWAVGAASVVIDRLLNVLSFCVTLPFSFITFGAQLVSILKIGQAAGGAALAAATVTTGKKGRSWKKTFTQVKEALVLWRRQPWQLVLAFVISWLSIFVIFLGVWVIARGLGIRVALYQVMGINVLTYLLTLLPISVNGYGVREVAMTTLYMQLGASLEQASTLALITRFFMLMETLPGALWLPQILPAREEVEEYRSIPEASVDPPAVP